MAAQISTRPLAKSDLGTADRIFREAFSKFLGLADPQGFMGDAQLIGPRWRANPAGAVGAYCDGALVGSSLATRWGSFGFVGPVSVRPDFWSQGVAKQLLEQMVALFERWGVRQSALFTFPQSPLHIALYQKFGFWPQYLTPVMAKSVSKPERAGAWSRFSKMPQAERAACLAQCAAVTDKIFSGLDLQPEIQSIAAQHLGDTVVITDNTGVAGFATCHVGKGSEAGSGAAFIKFGAVRPGADAPKLFEHLLDACEALAAESGCQEISAGVNAARHAAYRQMIDRGFRTFLEGVAMLRPNETGFNRPDCFVMDDLR